jgi:hypothetical protein
MKLFTTRHTVYIQRNNQSPSPVATSSSWHHTYAAAIGMALEYNQKGHDIQRIDCENDGYLDVATCMHIIENKRIKFDLTQYVRKPQVPVILAGFTLTPHFGMGQWGLVEKETKQWLYFPELSDAQKPQTAEAAKQYISGIYAKAGEQGFTDYITSVNAASLSGFISARLVPALRHRNNLVLNPDEFQRARKDKTFFNLETGKDERGNNTIALRFGTDIKQTFAVTAKMVTGNITEIMKNIVSVMKNPIPQAL